MHEEPKVKINTKQVLPTYLAVLGDENCPKEQV